MDKAGDISRTRIEPTLTFTNVPFEQDTLIRELLQSVGNGRELQPQPQKVAPEHPIPICTLQNLAQVR